MKLGQYLDVPLGAKKANILGAVLGVLLVTLLAAGVAIGALTVSNILTFGPFQVAPNLSEAVNLTETRGPPSSIASNEKYEFRFTIEAIKPVTNATLWFELSADTALNDPSVVQVTYEPPSGSPTVVDLKSTGEGRIRGALKAGWDIFAGSSDGEAKIKMIFLPNAPTGVSYFVEVWVDTPNAGASPPTDTNPGTTPTYVTVGDDFFSPGTINISAGSTVTWRFELSADTALNEPSVVQVTYEPPSGSPTVVDLKSTGEGRIRGALKAGWDIFAGSSDGEAKIKMIFLPNAPTGVSYFVEVWVDTPNAGASPPTDTNPGTTPTYVTVGDDFFSPGTINISAGSTVTWTWAGGSGVPHTTTGNGAEKWDSGFLTSGSYSHTFNAAGTFAYVCKVHSDMTGTIIVQ